MVFYIGDCSRTSTDCSEIVNISHIQDARYLQDGDIVCFLGHVFRWSLHDCVSEDTCHLWRTMSDPSCDAALEQIFPTLTTSVGKDLLVMLEEYVAANPGENAANTFLEEVSRLPPVDLLISDEQVELAQTFFVDHVVQIMQALLHYSLAAGFASSRIVRTLQAVSYLVPPLRETSAGQQTTQTLSSASDERTFSRLLETFQFVLDVTGCAVDPSVSKGKPGKAAYITPGGEGWRSAIKVRMLHGVARRRARERLQSSEAIDIGLQDVPISQEDMSATLVSFSTVPIWALKRLHLTPTPEETEAYLALWRHIGFYLGVSPSILSRYLHSPATAEKFLASIVLDLFSNDKQSNLRALPTIPILRAVSNRPPAYDTLEYNIAVTRYLIGGPLADHLQLPSTNWRMQLKLRLVLLVQAMPVWFGQIYPRRAWLQKRRAVLREGVARSLRWNLGMRRPSFRPRTDVQHLLDVTPKKGEQKEILGGELLESVKELEKVQPNPEAGKRLARLWKEVLYEMVGVSACCTLACGVSLSWIISRIVGW